MDVREERGRLLAQNKSLKHVDGAVWFCPSQTNAGGYIVNVEAQTCTCLDHETRACKCKHIFAVEYFQIVEVQADGSATVTESVKVTRKTYPQDWPAYNRAQCEEKAIVQALLRDLCANVASPPHEGRGPKPLPMADIIYGCVTKVYSTVSGRRATTDIRECEDRGMMHRAPSYNAIFKYMHREELTPILKALIEQSAAPLACVESKFAVDSTGFSTNVYRCWFDAKYGRDMREHTWLKAHVMTGCLTNVVTAVEVTEGTVNDCPELPGLVKTTAANGFSMAEVSADKAYLSHANLAAITATGAAPFIPFKSNSVDGASETWHRLFHFYSFKRSEFLAHYHQRSNVETTMSMIKRKFGGSLRSKLYTSQVNEVLCKVLCHNLAVLVSSIFELGIDPQFGAMKEVA